MLYWTKKLISRNLLPANTPICNKVVIEKSKKQKAKGKKPNRN